MNNNHINPYKVGDGATIRYWSDRNACTVIKVTPNSITIQRDKAILSPDFHPDWSGGAQPYCFNNGDQTYTYERDPNGEIYKAYYSARKRGYFVNKTLRVIVGRHEFYDYNF